MQKVIILFALLACTFSMTVNLDEMTNLWSSWKIYYGKSYGLAEEAARFAIFVENYKHVVEWNGENDDVKLALNKFADLTPEEFKNTVAGGYAWDGKFKEVVTGQVYENLADSVDWRTKGAVTPVKNQGQCGSCWSFSTTGVLEGLYFIKNGNLKSFSEQNLVDCDTGDDGCDGGLPSRALEYSAREGLELESDYPYTAKDGNCKRDASKAVVVNRGHSNVETKNANALKNAIGNQPVSIGIEADQQVFQFYKSGVISKNCGDDLDHAVLIVGYTTINGAEAFIVKNSWGADWGVQGYVYISTDGTANHGNGVCGILADPIVATD